MDNQKMNQNIPETPKGVLVFGSVLIFIGSFIALFVIQEVLGMYQQWGESSFIGALIEQFKNTELFVFSESPFILKEQGAFIIAFVLSILLASLGVQIAIALIRTGAHMMSPVVPYQFARIKLRIDKLNEKIKGK